MVENSMVMPTGVNTNRNRQRRVVFYGRVSSEHEAQLSALENQIQWYDDIATRHQNWMVLRKYVDEGITGTQTCYEWYMDFDLIEKPNEKKKMVWSFKIDYNEAKTYRKEREGMLRPNQWEDLIVRVYI